MVVAANVGVRHRRRIAAAVTGVLSSTSAVVLAVIVVAMGGTPPPAESAAGGTIPAVALDAYQRAVDSPLGVACGLRWQVLAGVGRVESNHAAGRGVSSDGAVAPPVIGPVLDGTGNLAAVADTDGGRLDGDATWDHAIGPMQFLPATWAAHGVDANGDRVADPQNLYDATAAAAAKLCAGRHLESDDDLAAALYAYNRSDAYVADVVGWITAYDQGLTGAGEAPGPTGTLVDVHGIVVDASLAAGLERLLAAAAADGLVLSGGGHRSYDDQVALRRAHCGASPYAVYEMPSDACSPPTARPGESQHEVGLAVDFTCAGTLVSRADPCFVWLSANAARFGLRPLTSEPWHWSTTGR